MGFVALYPLVTLRHPHVSTPHTSRNEFTYGEAEWKRIPLGTPDFAAFEAVRVTFPLHGPVRDHGPLAKLCGVFWLPTR